MRIARFALAPVICALLAACGSDSVTAPDAAPLADDVQCPETNCGGGGYVPPPPPYYWGSDTDDTYGWGSFGTSYAFHTTHTGWSWSEVVSPDYASGRVDATAYTYAQCQTRNRATYQSKSLTVYGIGKAEVSFSFKTNGQYGFQVRGTHTFTGRPGVANQTFYSEASHCDNSIFA